MATKKINILLSLTDKFSGKLKGSTEEIKKQKQALYAATNQLEKFGSKAMGAFSKVNKAAAVAATALGGLAFKTGLSEALDLEGYRTQLVTATKDTEKASELMRYAIGLANKTPFEGGEMVSAAAKFEAMAMDSTKWLSLAGDMAAATNKDLDQATEALIDAQTGELERLKEFGITKQMIIDEAEKMNKSVVNNKGQITDLQGFNDALVQLMQDKYTGGMEAQSKTIRGMWSTVTGITKNSLAKILGMTDDGTVKAGSMLEKLQQKVSQFSDLMQKWQSDGTIDKISDKVSAGFDKVWKVMEFVGKHSKGLAVIFGSLYITMGSLSVINKVAQGFTTAKTAVTALSSGFKVVRTVMMGALGPAGLIAVGVIAVGAALIYAYKHSEKFRNVCKTVFAAVKNFVLTLKDAMVMLKDGFVKAFQTMKDKASDFVTKIKQKLQPLLDFINTLKDGLSELGFGLANVTGSTPQQYTVGERALGTPYFAGGLTSVNERGGEIMNLPNGTQIIPHDISEKMVQSPSVNVNLTIQGNVIGNRQFMEQVGSYISQKVIASMGVV